jgi:hypothetical protein
MSDSSADRYRLFRRLSGSQCFSSSVSDSDDTVPEGWSAPPLPGAGPTPRWAADDSVSRA